MKIVYKEHDHFFTCQILGLERDWSQFKGGSITHMIPIAGNAILKEMIH